MAGDLHKEKQEERVAVVKRLTSKQVDVVPLRPKKVQSLKQCVTIRLDQTLEWPSEQQCVFAGPVLALARPVVREVAEQPFADPHPPGEMPLAASCVVQRGVLAAGPRGPWHPDMGRQVPPPFRKIQKALHDVVQQRKPERHVVVQVGLRKDVRVMHKLEPEVTDEHQPTSVKRRRHPSGTKRLEMADPLPWLSPPSVVAVHVSKSDDPPCKSHPTCKRQASPLPSPCERVKPGGVGAHPDRAELPA